ncbi:MAG: glycosyltransferase [Planctomycetaceae bacterium]
MASYPATVQAIGDLNVVPVESVLQGRSAAAQFVWQNTRLGGWLRERRIDVCLNINHYLLNLGCPQVIYHLNLLRFPEQPRSGWSMATLAERLRDWTAKRALTHADANVFESKFLESSARRIAEPRNPQVVYIGLPERLHELAQQARVKLESCAEAPEVGNSGDRNPLRIVSVTSPAPHKDNGTLIRMLQRLIELQPNLDWHLDVAGGTNPAAWESTRRLAEELEVDNRIQWHGFCDNDQLTKLMQSALCLVSTSRVESFCMVALEAMARGCPAVVADCAAMPESVGAAGLLAQPGNPDSFARAVLSLADDVLLRRQLVAEGLQWIGAFRWKECGLQFRKLLSDVASK